MPSNLSIPIDAVILAGGVPEPGHPLYPETQGRPKAMLPIADKPMYQWVLEAVAASSRIRRIVVIGCPDTSISLGADVTYLPNAGGIIENLSAGAAHILAKDPQATRFLAVSADIPTIRAEMVDAVVGDCNEPGVDIFFNVIERSDMQRDWPGVPRTWMRLADGHFCAADLHVISTQLFASDVVRRFVAWRKSPLRLMAALGPAVLLRMLLRRPSLADCTKIITSRTGIRALAIRRSCTDIGMDVDNPIHLAAVRRRLAPGAGGLALPEQAMASAAAMPAIPMRILIHSGDSLVLFPLVAILAWLGPASVRPLSGQAWAAMLLAGAAGWILKQILRRPRPAGTFGQSYRRYDPYAFPSGHAARTTALAMSWLLADPSALSLAIWAWALATSWVRVRYGLHHVWDVWGGMAVGIASAIGLYTAGWPLG